MGNGVGGSGTSRPRPDLDRAFTPADTPPQYARERTFQELHLRLVVSIDDMRRSVSGTATHRLAAINDGLREVILDQQDLRIRGVRDESGRALDWETRGDTLLVRLAKPRQAGDAFELRIRYSCSPRKGLYFTGPDDAYLDKPSTVWTQGEEQDNRSWFPSYDYPNEKFTTEIVVTVNERFQAIANGRLVSEKHDRGNGTRTFHWLQDKPHPSYLVGLVVGEWDVKEWDADGVPVQAYVPKGRGKDIDLCFSRVPEMVRFYGRLTGLKFPWDKYAQACVPEFIFGAMENTTITIMDDGCLTDERAYPDYNSDATLSHELVHHWFGDWITCKSFGHVWLKEGFANYFEALWWEERYGKDEFLLHLEEMRRRYFEEAEKDYMRPIVTHTFVDPKEMFDAHTYCKGAAVLHMLRSYLGDALWWKGIRAYVAAHGTSAVETADFKRAMEAATGKTLDGFFEQWLDRRGHPEFEVSWSWDPRTRQAAVRVKQTQETKDGVPVFRVPVTLELASDDQARQESVELEKADHTFEFSCRERPRAILFDPDGVLLKRLQFPRSAAELRWVLTHSGHLLSRLEACAQLGRTGSSSETVPVLEERLEQDPQWPVRQAAASALGEVGTSAARDALVRSIGDQDSRVRAAIYEALGRFRKDEGAFGALAQAYRQEGKYYATAAAAAALGATRHVRAFDALVEGMDRGSHAEVIASHAADGLAALGDERGLEVLSQRTRYGEPEMRRYAMAVAMGRLGRIVEERRMDVMEQLIALTKDRNQRTKLGAIEGLGELGSPRSIPALERIVEGELLWSFKKRARRALRRIRDSEAERAPLLEQQKALDSLDEERLEMARRVSILESRADALRRTRR